MKRIADESGGRYGLAENREQLSALYASFGESMRSEYELTYRSPYGLRNGVNRSLSVTMHSPLGASVQPGASTSYNPGGLIPEVPVSGSWLIFLAMLAFLGLLAVVPMLIPWIQERGQKSKATIKLKEPKKVAIKFKN